MVCRGVYRLKVARDGAADGAPEADRADVAALLDARLRAQGVDPARCKHKRYAERGYEPASCVARGALMLAGEAAGIDPMTGEGIAQAIETGALAARAVAEGGAPAGVAERYRAAVHQALGRDLRFAAVLQRLLKSRHITGAALRAAGLTPWTRRNFARWMFEDYPRATLFTPDRWQRRLLTPTGAFGPGS
jgi:flavin-dependent dehydrogenase